MQMRKEMAQLQTFATKLKLRIEKITAFNFGYFEFHFKKKESFRLFL